MPSHSKQGLIKSDETLFEIIDTIYEQESAGVTEISEQVGISTSAVHKHLKTLEAYEFVQNNGGKYRLGLKFLQYGGQVRDANYYYNEIWPKVHELAIRTDKMAAFQVRDSDYAVLLYLFHDEYNLRLIAPLGDRCYLHQSAAGQTMLAHLSNEKIESYIQRTGLPVSTDKTIDNKQDLFDRMELIRDRGYTISHGERIEGLLAVSAPIQDSEGNLYGAMSLTEPLAPQAENRVSEDLVEPLLNTVNDIKLKFMNRSKKSAEWP